MTRPDEIPQMYKGKPLRWVWTYKSDIGTVLGYIARYDDATGKECIPFFVPNGSIFTIGAHTVPRPLFGLDTLKNPREIVYITEGEKCASALQALDLSAVSAQGGANSVLQADWTPLQAFGCVVLLPDHDEPGERYAADVVRCLDALPGSREILVCQLPGLPEAGDVVDWLQIRLPEWDGFQPLPRETGEELSSEILNAIKEYSANVPFEWCTSKTKTVADLWELPVSLDAAVIPPWPQDVFPPEIQSFVDALSRSTETPVELAVMMVLAVLATAAQGKFRVRIKPDYFEPLCLWTCCALPPGNRKTAVWQAAIKPLSEWERERHAKMEPEILQIQSKRKTMEARINVLTKKAAGEKNSFEFDRLQAEIADLESSILPIPVLPQLRADDITPENLATVMKDNHECMALLSDEGGVLDIIAGRYSNGVPNLDVYLHGHAGSSIRVNRGSRPSVFLEDPCLTVGICPQPDVVKSMQDKPGFRGRGFIGRFLYAMPVSNLGRRTNHASPMPDDVRGVFHHVVWNMLDLPWNTDIGGKDCPHILHLSQKAYQQWDTFSSQNELSLVPGGTFEHATDWAGKLPGAVARIAAVFHVTRHAAYKPWETEISGDEMAAAIRVAEVLKQHALIVFDIMGSDKSLDDARAILSWIQRGALLSFTQRECHKAQKHRCKHAGEIEAALDVLAERGYIRQHPQSTTPQGGRPSKTFDVNPSAQKVQNPKVA